MRHITEDITGFNGSGYGNQFSVNLNTGPTYKEISVRTENVNNDQAARITLTLNGDPIVDLTGEELRMLEAYKSNYQEDGRFVIPLADFSAVTQAGQDLTGLVTLPEDNLVLNVYLGAATAQQTTDGDIPAVSAFAVMDESVATRKFIPRLYSDLIPMGKTGKNYFKNFNRGPRIRRIHFASTAVSELEVKRDKVDSL